MFLRSFCFPTGRFQRSWTPHQEAIPPPLCFRLGAGGATPLQNTSELLHHVQVVFHSTLQDHFRLVHLPLPLGAHRVGVVPRNKMKGSCDSVLARSLLRQSLNQGTKRQLFMTAIPTHDTWQWGGQKSHSHLPSSRLLSQLQVKIKLLLTTLTMRSTDTGKLSPPRHLI